MHKLFFFLLFIPSLVNAETLVDNIFKSTPIGSWQEREVYTWKENKAFISHYKIARVFGSDADKTSEPGSYVIEIKIQRYSLINVDVKEPIGPEIIIKLVYPESFIARGIHILELKPLENAQKVIVKIGEETPVTVSNMNIAYVFRFIGPSFNFTTFDSNSDELIDVPAGFFRAAVFESKTLEKSRWDSDFNVSGTHVDAKNWIVRGIPFGTVRSRTTIRDPSGNLIYFRESQLLRFGHRGAFGQLFKKPKETPFSSLWSFFD